MLGALKNTKVSNLEMMANLPPLNLEPSKNLVSYAIKALSNPSNPVREIRHIVLN